ncbi:tryptophan synthase beta subunit-like PLP-dependent enzyme [Paraphysoderma sedebokerense]|nr:tryptophan synthase beta subunit-like PLP-dependent enzyme [Paraphysoderma sedebokerense]
MAIPTINRTISIEKINGRPISNDEPLKINNGVTIVKDENTDDEDEIDYLKLILNARVYDVCKETELTYAKNLSRKTGNKVLLKREDMQPVFSFKCRGAYNRMFQLTPSERQRGVIAVSAGNHAQGVALAAQTLNIPATILMPTFAPSIKVENVKRLGATVILHGNDFDEAKQEMYRLAVERGLVVIPPFDDPYVIAGQGTVGVEILRQVRQDRLDAIFVCVGGGGLLAGVAAYVKRIRPEVKVIGVNTIDSDAMTKSLQKGKRLELSEVGLFSDGSAVRLVGKETFRLCKALVDDMVLVTTDEICAAIKDTFEDTRSIVEPAGALGVAGLKKYLAKNPQIKDGVFVAVLSGANMNFDRLRFVAERARLGEGKEAMLSVKIRERPGEFNKLYEVLNVTEFSYRYSDPTWAHIIMAFEVQGGNAEVEGVVGEFEKREMKALDITDNEMAKSHARYLAGGRSATVENEKLYRFRFPERPGALKRFLNYLQSDWNISLFHYRNHGGDVGKVLVGIQVPPEQTDKFQQFLDKLGYPYVDETDNPVYLQFLR